MEDTIIANRKGSAPMFPALFSLFTHRIPEDVHRRLTISAKAHRVAESLAHLEPEANREILTQAAAILGVEVGA
jgi:hypothetical protein